MVSFEMVETSRSLTLWEKMTPMERVVMSCIVAGQKRGLTCTGLDITETNYSRLRSRIMNKLDCQTDVDLAWKACRLGWVRFTIDNAGRTLNVVWTGGSRMPPVTKSDVARQ